MKDQVEISLDVSLVVLHWSYLVSQMVLCCINVQRVIKIQKVLQQKQRRRHETKMQREEAKR